MRPARLAAAHAGRGMRHARVAAVAAGAALAAAGLVPAVAGAGTFRVSQCAALDGSTWSPRTIQSSLWRGSGGYLTSTCGSSGGMIQLVPPNFRLHNDWTAAALFSIPASLPHTSIRAFWLDWTASAQSASVDPAFAVIYGGTTMLFASPVPAGTRPGTTARLVPPSGTRSLNIGLWCSPVHGPGYCNWPGSPLQIRSLSLDLDESVPPAVAASGALLDGTPQKGSTTLSLHATDADSGVRSVEASLAGVRIAAVDLAAECADDRLAPCPPDVRRTIEVDTSRIPDGSYRLRLHVTDLAGNATDADAGRVVVANEEGDGSCGLGSPGSCPPGGDQPSPTPQGSGGGAPTPACGVAVACPGAGGAGPTSSVRAPFPPNPLAGQGHVPNGRDATERARIVVRLQSGRRRAVRLTLAAGRRVRVTGRLAGRDGTPIGRALLTLVERRPGHRWHVAAVLRTRADGHFAEPLRAGPSRTLSVVYHAFGDSRRGHWSRHLALRVRARVTLTAVVLGSGRRLVGRVSGPVPPGGLIVRIEGRDGGLWTVLRRVVTDEAGRFAADAPRGTGSVRARVAARAGYPYASGMSRAVRLR